MRRPDATDAASSGSRHLAASHRGGGQGGPLAGHRWPEDGKTATIITTNLDYDAWYSFLGQKEMVGAALDRLRHRCHTIRIEGQTLRTPDPELAA